MVIGTRDDSPRFVRELLAQESSAYLDGNSSPGNLVATVLAARGLHGAANVLVIVPKAVPVKQEEMANPRLSRRELKVLMVIAWGLSNHQIAHCLHLTEATVRRHFANLYPKLDAGSCSEVARKALTEGRLDVRDLTQDARDQRGRPRRLRRFTGKGPKIFGGWQREGSQAPNEMRSATVDGARPCGGPDVGGESS